MSQSIKLKQLQDYLIKNENKDIGKSEWKFIDQNLINNFANVTNDFNKIHTCPEEAKNTPLGKTIAHGFLTLSLLTDLAKDVLPKIEDKHMAINYGFDKIRFMHPVFVNSRIRALFKLSKYDIRLKDNVFIYYDVKLEIENIKKLALKARWIIAINSI